MANLLKIKSIADKKNISLKEIANHLDITPTGLSKILRENSTKTSTLEKIALKLKVPVSVFFSDDPYAEKKEYPVNSDVLNTHVAEEKHGYLCGNSGIPLVSTEAIAGFGNVDFSIQEQDIQSHYDVPDFININFMIRVKGSSMYPKYNSGDVVACRIIRESSFIQWNKVHVLATKEQGVLIKRLKKGSTPECLCAVSDNKDYDPFEIPTDEITGLAIVIGVIRLE